MGHQSTFTYNALGQPVNADFAATTNTPSEHVAYTYGANGRMNSVTDNRGTTTMTYESGCDRVANVHDPVTGDTGYTYGITGERASISLSGGGKWDYYYEPLPTNTINYYLICPKADVSSIARRLVTIKDDAQQRCDYFIDHTGLMRWARWNEAFDSNTGEVCERG